MIKYTIFGNEWFIKRSEMRSIDVLMWCGINYITGCWYHGYIVTCPVCNNITTKDVCMGMIDLQYMMYSVVNLSILNGKIDFRFPLALKRTAWERSS